MSACIACAWAAFFFTLGLAVQEDDDLDDEEVEAVLDDRIEQGPCSERAMVSGGSSIPDISRRPSIDNEGPISGTDTTVTQWFA